MKKKTIGIIAISVLCAFAIFAGAMFTHQYIDAKNPKARKNRSFPRRSLRQRRRLLPMKNTVLFLRRIRTLSAGSRLTAQRLIILSCSPRTIPTII